MPGAINTVKDKTFDMKFLFIIDNGHFKLKLVPVRKHSEM